MAMAHPFVLEELQSLLSPDRLRVKAMFGSHALYVDEKIVFILRHKATPDDGVWVALSDAGHAKSLVSEFPTLRGIEMFAQRAFGDWVLLPEDGEGFEESAMGLCALLGKRDARLGKVPKGRKKRAARS